jgi:ubiquinone/menaquinone biosynthesis C-methylase UbiE
MEDTFQAISDFDLNMICEFFKDLDRQGPGSEQDTLRALSFLSDLPQNPKILDLGCGAGGQTITAAKQLSAEIIGVDSLPGMIDSFNARVANAGLSDRVKGVIGSMCELPYKEHEFDVVLAEGSIYNIGFERGINYWKRFIKPGGYLVVSEATWFTNSRPIEIENYWAANYSGIDTISNKIKQLEVAGYMPVASFAEPETSWLDNYYIPLQMKFTEFLNKYSYSEFAKQFVDRQKQEIEYYYKYKKYFGYAFFIAKNI